MAGRPAKSTAEHRRNGTFNVTRHADRDDEALATGDPIKPDDLTGPASELWDAVLAGKPAGAKAACDGFALAGMCRWFALWKRYMDEAEAEADIKAAWTKICAAGMAWKHFSTTAAKFGLTPADRTKIRITETPPPADDPLAAVLAEREKWQINDPKSATHTG